MGILTTILMGFFIGLIFAGFSGISAGLQASDVIEKMNAQAIEEYWAQTDLQEKDLRVLVNNEQCRLSEKLFLSCVNSVLNTLKIFQERLSLSAEILPALTDTSSLDHFNEKENLEPFSKLYKENLATSFNFKLYWDIILKKADRSRPLKYLVAQGLNGYLSIQKDPHTYILPLKYFEQVSSSAERSPYFVGLAVDKEASLFRIKKITPTSDADLAGLKKNDYIVSINGKESKHLTTNEIGQILRDKNVRTFLFVILRSGQTYLKKIQRSYRVLNQVQWQIIPGYKNYGLISVTKFSKNTCSEVTQALRAFGADSQNNKVSGLILDLRDNPGGHLDEAACLTGLFLGRNKKAYSIQYFDISKSEESILTSSDQIYSGPLVLLVNSNSASAAELFSGAIQDYGRGVLLGEKTFGKGTFQEVEMWKSSSTVGYFKTQGFYLLPSGRSTQFYGIEPDIKFDEGNINRSNEQLNYLNPIRPQLVKNYYQPKQLPIQLCQNKTSHLNMNIDTQGLEPLLIEALRILSCSELMSHIAIQSGVGNITF